MTIINNLKLPDVNASELTFTPMVRVRVRPRVLPTVKFLQITVYNKGEPH